MSERHGKHHISGETSENLDVTPEKRLENALNRIAYALDQSRKGDTVRNQQALVDRVERLRLKVQDLRDRFEGGDAC